MSRMGSSDFYFLASEKQGRMVLLHSMFVGHRRHTPALAAFDLETAPAQSTCFILCSRDFQLKSDDDLPS